MGDNLKKHLAAGIVGVVVLVVLFALMGVNFMAWIGVWFTPKMPYIVGIPLTVLLGVMGAWLYAGSVAKAEWGPPVVRGLIFGVFAAVLFIWVMPWFFSSVVGEATGVRGASTGIALFSTAHVPALEFDAPLAKLADEPWANNDDWKGRLIPFSIAFAALGLTLGLMVTSKKS
jgi:hypothetical protein